MVHFVVSLIPSSKKPIMVLVEAKNEKKAIEYANRTISMYTWMHMHKDLCQAMMVSDDDEVIFHEDFFCVNGDHYLAFNHLKLSFFPCVENDYSCLMKFDDDPFYVKSSINDVGDVKITFTADDQNDHEEPKTVEYELKDRNVVACLASGSTIYCFCDNNDIVAVWNDLKWEFCTTTIKNCRQIKSIGIIDRYPCVIIDDNLYKLCKYNDLVERADKILNISGFRNIHNLFN